MAPVLFLWHKCDLSGCDTSTQGSGSQLGAILSQGTFGNVWRDFGLPQLEEVPIASGGYRTDVLLSILRSTGQVSITGNYPVQNASNARLRNPGLDRLSHLGSALEGQ